MVAKECVAVFIILTVCIQWANAGPQGGDKPPKGFNWSGGFKMPNRWNCAARGHWCSAFKKCCDSTDHCFDHPKAKQDLGLWCVADAGFSERVEKSKSSPFDDGMYY